jgi:calcineurin-like phosphoesterase
MNIDSTMGRIHVCLLYCLLVTIRGLVGPSTHMTSPWAVLGAEVNSTSGKPSPSLRTPLLFLVNTSLVKLDADTNRNKLVLRMRLASHFTCVTGTKERMFTQKSVLRTDGTAALVRHAPHVLYNSSRVASQPIF